MDRTMNSSSDSAERRTGAQSAGRVSRYGENSRNTSKHTLLVIIKNSTLERSLMNVPSVEKHSQTPQIYNGIWSHTL